MTDFTVSHRYAVALFEAAKEKKVVDAVSADMSSFSKEFQFNKDLQHFLSSPVIDGKKKVALLNRSFSNFSALSNNFITLLSNKNRLAYLGAISHEFMIVSDRHAGIVTAEIFSSVPLDESVQQNIKSVLEKKTGNPVRVSFQAKPEIKGGLIVKIGDTVFDGSVKNKLEQISARFKGQ